MKRKITNGILIILIILLIIYYFVSNITQNKVSVKMEILESNVSQKGYVVCNKTKIYVGKKIKMDKYYCNDIEILEINDEYVKISRDAIKYDGTTSEHMENVIQDVKYGEEIDADINTNIFTGMRFENYIIRFVKTK